MKKTSQSAEILEHLKSGKSLTPVDALQLFGCFRLAARISELRGTGHDIRNTMVHSERNKKVRFACYYLPQVPA